MKTEIRTITKSIAEEMLKRNPNNRKINERHVSFLVKQMINGSWQFDGQPIRFDTFGRLLDGQHRLTAIVESNKSFDFLVVSGIDESAFKVMDTGKNRSAGDSLSAMDVQYHTDVAAVAKNIIMFESERFSLRGFRVTNTEIIKWYEENDNVVDFVKRAHPLYLSYSRVLSRSMIATFLIILGKKDPVASELFISKLCTGLDLETTSPIFLLRKKLIEDRLSKASLPLTDKIALIIKAWNFYRLGREIKLLRWDKNTEDFPTII